ncbi:hypothetical protein YC2023_053024 [Brassica napus]
MVHDLDMVVNTDSPPSVVLLTAVHASGYNESGHKPNTLDRGYIKSHSASHDDPFNPSQFQKVPFAFSDHIQHPAKVILPILGFFKCHLTPRAGNFSFYPRVPLRLTRCGVGAGRPF